LIWRWQLHRFSSIILPYALRLLPHLPLPPCHRRKALVKLQKHQTCHLFQ
jgi:hypothetical protein